MYAEFIVLRLIHVLGGIVWVGAFTFTTFFLMPSVAEAGPAAAPVLAGLGRRKVFVIIPIVAVLTILSGIRLMMIASGGFGAAYFATRTGMTLLSAAVAATLAFILGMALARPAALRIATLTQLSAAEPTKRETYAAEIAVLRRRAAMANAVVIVLLLLAAAGMAVARYL